MKRPASKIVVSAMIAGVALIAIAGARLALREKPGPGTAGTSTANDDTPCGGGFFRRGPRCCPTDTPLSELGHGLCAVGAPAQASSCPAPLVVTTDGCDAPRGKVLVPATSVLIGPSDWEAEGRVKARTVKAGPFEIDRFEMTVGRAQCDKCPPKLSPRLAGRDVARAVSYVTLDEARAVCAAYGGRLPTEDEWIVAAAGDRPRRYPWGDTGAVCRRAAWGLMRGPCGTAATGPDTVGAHPDGATPLGIHDLAGNVAEWVESATPCEAASPTAAPSLGTCLGVVRGGSYETDLATELRTWVRREVLAGTTEASVGFRCAYDVEGSEGGTPATNAP
jgi:formylglycine-generating enzyme required for sulfatase activity